MDAPRRPRPLRVPRHVPVRRTRAGIRRARSLRRQRTHRPGRARDRVDGVRHDLAAASVRGRAGIAWSRADFLASGERFVAHGIDRIVTDPPWGFHQGIGDREDFYRRLFTAINVTLRPGGIAVVLAPNLGAPPDTAALVLRESHPVLIHGKKARLLKLEKG